MPCEKEELLNANVCRVDALEAELITAKKALHETLMRQKELLTYIDRQEANDDGECCEEEQEANDDQVFLKSDHYSVSRQQLPFNPPGTMRFSTPADTTLFNHQTPNESSHPLCNNLSNLQVKPASQGAIASYFEIPLLHNQADSANFARGTNKDTLNQGVPKTLNTNDKHSYSYVAISSSAAPQYHLPIYATRNGQKNVNENAASKKIENGSGSCKRQFTDEMEINKNTSVQSKRL
ncbi:phosphatidylinositol/phosphatidylcholine transfer protein SFH8 [Artemisia annua]|uniref:Phosphatidylinositol/phosphatidylcholine transfer protein SFH8 n=1 Tax=Artemisia annua TaxID=35608 RepID=A0A2U1Q494_ARTAN|nr:phosphatidylinositol/phosphatidylcholine transfer protein SFH8 [Artemisia annua]